MASCKNDREPKLVLWYNSIEIFFISHLTIFSKISHIDWSILFNFETTQCMNHFDMNLLEIHSVAIEILSISCFVQFLVKKQTGAIFECQMSKNRNGFMQKSL